MPANENTKFSEHSILQWLEKVRDGDNQAAAVIWDRFFPDLVELARLRFPASAGRVDDEEDVALSVLDSFFKAAKLGRFPDLQDADSLWRLLSEMTRRKVVDRIRRHIALKKGGGKLRGDSAFIAVASGQSELPAADILPSDLEAILQEQIHLFLTALRETDSRFEQVALARMEGCTNQELADRFDCSPPTIERWLRRIRKIGKRFFEE